MPEQSAEPSPVEPDFFAVFGLASLGGSRSFHQRRHCGKRAGLGESGIGRKHDQRSGLKGAEGIGLIAPIKKMRTRPNGLIAVFGGVVVGEEAFRFFVDAATFDIVTSAGE